MLSNCNTTMLSLVIINKTLFHVGHTCEIQHVVNEPAMFVGNMVFTCNKQLVFTFWLIFVSEPKVYSN